VPEWVVGLVGVVVGGLLTGGVAYFLEQRREKREARAAQLVMKSEIEAAATAVEAALSGKEPKWPPGWDRVGWSESWATYRPVLAKTVNEVDFARLAGAYLQMQLLQAGLAAGERGLSNRDEVFLGKVKSEISKADEVLVKSMRRRQRTYHRFLKPPE
jgi:hypothetical protein